MFDIKVLTAAALVPLSVMACSLETSAKSSSLSAATTEESVNQSSVCIFRDLGNTGKCRTGQKLVLLPEERFAREELSLMFAADFCDFRYTVIANRAGVVCIYNPTAEKSAQTPEVISDAAMDAVKAFEAAKKAAGE